MTTNHGNVFLFPTRKPQQESESQNTIVGVKSKVHAAQVIPSLHTIYWERDTRNYLHARKFFEILKSYKHITISATDNSDITYDSIMTVSDKNEGEYRLPVDYFIRMTIENPANIENNMSSILDHISNLNIRVGMTVEDISISRTVLTEEEIDCYKPEEISGFINKDSFYQCEMYHEFGLPIGWGEVDMFQLSSNNITLLDLMIISLENTEVGGYKIAGANMEIIANNRDETIITTITANLLEQIIHNSLQRINPFLYGNRSFRSAHQHYFQTVVVPKMKPENEQVDIDE